MHKDMTSRTIAAAYMTGILPIKKYGTESALSDFEEFTMTEPLILTEYIGFTEQEVLQLCRQYEVDFDKVKQCMMDMGLRTQSHSCYEYSAFK